MERRRSTRGWVTAILLAASLTVLAPLAAGLADGEDPSVSVGEGPAAPGDASEEANRSTDGGDLGAQPAAGGGSGQGGTSAGSGTTPMAASTSDWLVDHGWWLVGALMLVGARRAWGDRSTGEAEAPEDAGDEQNAARDHPGPEGVMLLGNRALQAGEPEVAEGWFATALELDEDLAIAALCRGLCRVEMGQPGRARASLSRAVDLEPSDGTARYHLARAQALDGATTEAVRTLEPLVRMRPDVIGEVHDDGAFADVRETGGWRSLAAEWK